MRSAGCVVNDILDRKIDKMVERTRKIGIRTIMTIIMILEEEMNRPMMTEQKSKKKIVLTTTTKHRRPKMLLAPIWKTGWTTNSKNRY